MPSLFGRHFENRLTEKRMADRRFRATEAKILKIATSRKSHLKAQDVASNANISRTTFYRHHKAVEQIPQDYADYLLKTYKSQINKLTRRPNVSVKHLYIRTLTFILSHRSEFKALQHSANNTIFASMIKALEPKIITACRLPANSDHMLIAYRGEVSEILTAWGQKGFLARSSNTILRDIMYLTSSIRTRLAPLTAPPVEDKPLGQF